jgi:hypothetical protein
MKQYYQQVEINNCGNIKNKTSFKHRNKLDERDPGEHAAIKKIESYSGSSKQNHYK